MKIFLDTANLEANKKWHAMHIIDGVTTNPTHLSKEGGDPLALIKMICAAMPSGDISVETTEDDPQKLYEQAKKIAAIAPNVVVKVPCDVRYYAVIQQLVSEGIRLNITLLFSLAQGLMMCKLGVTYISPFVGRLDDIDANGAALLHALCNMVDMYGYQTEILAASLRNSTHFDQAILAGVDAATVPIELLESVVTHVLTHQGMQRFADDWKKLGVSQFP